jgi:hypothetical protein
MKISNLSCISLDLVHSLLFRMIEVKVTTFETVSSLKILKNVLAREPRHSV